MYGTEIFLGGPPKFLPSVAFYGTPTINVLLHFCNANSGLCCSMEPNFSRKICQKFDTFSEILSKNQFFTLHNGLK